MVKSGLIFGAVTFLLILLSSLLSPICAPCLGLILGWASGYSAGGFDKPGTQNDSLRIGAIAGAIAGCIGFVGGMIGGALNGTIVNASSVEQFYRSLGITNIILNQSQLLAYQLIGAACIGVFNIAWMALLGFAGGALWYQRNRKDQPSLIMPPQEPLPPSL
jgi:hypothetical protein